MSKMHIKTNLIVNRSDTVLLLSEHNVKGILYINILSTCYNPVFGCRVAESLIFYVYIAVCLLVAFTFLSYVFVGSFLFMNLNVHIFSLFFFFTFFTHSRVYNSDTN